MNIADKARLYAEIHRVLRPGGRLALHEILAGPDAPVYFPVPWARDPAISFLASPEATRAAITGAGFHPLAWEEPLHEHFYGILDQRVSVASFRINRNETGGTAPQRNDGKTRLFTPYLRSQLDEQVQRLISEQRKIIRSCDRNRPISSRRKSSCMRRQSS